jgi:hypothetical protein
MEICIYQSPVPLELSEIFHAPVERNWTITKILVMAENRGVNGLIKASKLIIKRGNEEILNKNFFGVEEEIINNIPVDKEFYAETDNPNLYIKVYAEEILHN